ncbi:MAG: preprotein translocase subunit Sec61beta [Candidatus Woesearchaeota archaeon]|nr:preprotein translocase subunit Sec61beta [Candidatus Woesearchaeota archaeon]
MSKEKMSMPMSGAGITRYFDDYKSKISIKPGHVVFLAIVVMAAVILLNIFGASIFG